MPYVTEGMGLVPIFYISHDGERGETYASYEQEGRRVTITMSRRAFDVLMKAEESEEGLMREGLVALYNYYNPDIPLPPKCLHNLRVKPEKKGAKITFSVEKSLYDY